MYRERGNNDEDRILIPDKIRSVSMFWVSVLFVGTSIFSAPLQIGSYFDSGIIFSLIFVVFFGLMTFYAMWMLSRAVISTQQDSVALIWKQYSPKTVFIPCLMILIPCLGDIVYLYNSSYRMFSHFLNRVTKGSPPFFLDDYFVYCIIISVIILPGIIFRQDVRYFRIITICKIIVIIAILLTQIVHLIRTGMSFNYNTGVFYLFKPEIYNFLRLFDFLMMNFSFLMFYYSVVTQMKRITERRLNTLNRIGLSIVLLSAILFGLIQYLDFGNALPEGKYVYDIYSEDSIEKTLMIFWGLIMTVLFLPLFMFPAIRSLLGVIQVVSPFPRDIWALSVLAIAFISIFLGKLEGRTFNIFFFFVGFFLALQDCVFPVMFYLSVVKHPPPIHVCGCILMVALFVFYCVAHIINNLSLFT